MCGVGGGVGHVTQKKRIHTSKGNKIKHELLREGFKFVLNMENQSICVISI